MPEPYILNYGTCWTGMVTDDFVCHLTLRPVWGKRPPEVTVMLDGHVRWQGLLEADLTLDWGQSLERGSHCLEVAFSGKTNEDTTAEHDHAVVIDHVDFFGIRDDKFRWQGVYRPDYPEPWRTEQESQGIELLPELTAHTYLGWNGTWRLDFTTPIFTWMHQIQDLGWIYD